MASKALTAEEKKRLDEKKAEDKKQLTLFTDRTNLIVKNLGSGAIGSVYDDLGKFIELIREAGDNKFHNPDCDKQFYTNVLVKAVTAILTRKYVSCVMCLIVHSTPLHCTALHCTPLHSTAVSTGLTRSCLCALKLPNVRSAYHPARTGGTAIGVGSNHEKEGFGVATTR